MSPPRKKSQPEAPVLENPLPRDPGDLPTLMDAEPPPVPRITAEEIDAVQAELTAMTRDLADRLLDHAMRDMEAALVEQVSNRLREELPALIEKVLREHLEPGD